MKKEAENHVICEYEASEKYAADFNKSFTENKEDFISKYEVLNINNIQSVKLISINVQCT